MEASRERDTASNRDPQTLRIAGGRDGRRRGVLPDDLHAKVALSEKLSQYLFGLPFRLPAVIVATGGTLHQLLCVAQGVISDGFRDADKWQPGF